MEWLTLATAAWLSQTCPASRRVHQSHPRCRPPCRRPPGARSRRPPAWRSAAWRSAAWKPWQAGRFARPPQVASEEQVAPMLSRSQPAQPQQVASSEQVAPMLSRSHPRPRRPLFCLELVDAGALHVEGGHLLHEVQGLVLVNRGEFRNRCAHDLTVLLAVVVPDDVPLFFLAFARLDDHLVAVEVLALPHHRIRCLRHVRELHARDDRHIPL